MGRVSVVRTANEILKSVLMSLDNIGGIAKFVHPNSYVLLKPNINGTEAVTNILVVESLIIILKEAGVNKIAIAESTFGDANMTDLCFKKTGYLELACKHNIPILNLNRSRAVCIKVQNSLIADEIEIAEEVFEADLIINIPVMKVHYATAVTLAMKNLKGLLVGNEKRRFHEIGLDKAIVDLNTSIGPTLNVIDCTVCMERMGPKGGDPVHLNLLISGYDRGEVDYVGSQIMGYSLDEVKHLKYYIEIRNTNIDAIEYVGENISDVKYFFVKTQIKNCVPSNFEINNTDACSSCENALLLSCQFLGENAIEEASIFMGNTTLLTRAIHKFTVGFGNCSKQNDISYDESVAGCPPYPFALKKIFETRAKERINAKDAREEGRVPQAQTANSETMPAPTNTGPA